MAQDASTETAEQRRASTRADLRALANKTITVAASVIRLLCAIFAAILVIFVVLFVAGANPLNGITVFFSDAASNFTLGIADSTGFPLGPEDLFQPQSPSLRVILNLGLAAVVWVVIGLVVSRILNALAP